LASSRKPVGRLAFVLRVLLLTAAAVALERFLPDRTLANLSFLPKFWRPLPSAMLSGLILWPFGDAIRGRLRDARLSDWYSVPIVLIWIFSILLLSMPTYYWPIGLSLLVLLLIAGGVIPSKPGPPENAFANNGTKEIPVAPPPSFSPRLFVTPIGFLRTLLTFACIWVPLIWLEESSIDGLGALVAHVAYFIVGFVWFFKVLGRFEDAGRSSTRYGTPFFIIALIASMIPLWLKLSNGYEALALFVAIQVPLVLLRSKPQPDLPVPPPRELSAFRKRLKQRREERGLKRKTAKPFFVLPHAFLRRLLVIGCLWALLISVEHASDNWVGVLFAHCGYFILTFAWIMNLDGRFKDAGWAHDWYGSQFVLLVSVASLMPVAFHWVNGYGALAIFVLIQTPIVFLPSKPRPEEPLPESSGSDENEECLRDPWEGIRVKHAEDEAGIAYQQPGSGFVRERGLGVSNWVPKRRRY